MSTLSLTTNLNGSCLSTRNPGRFTPGITTLSTVQETGWVPGTLWTGAGNIASIKYVIGVHIRP